MPQNQHKKRGIALEPEQITFITIKLQAERLTQKAAAELCGITEGSIRSALKANGMDSSIRDAIIKGLDVPDVNRLKQDYRNRYNFQRDRNRFFTGREDKMEVLCAALKSSHFAAVTQALSGLGGAGKTSTAIEYAYRCLDKAHFPNYPTYKTIQFVRADTTDVLKDGYANIANALQLRRADPNNPEEAVHAVVQWMTRPEEGPWLLILDNADDPDNLTEFLPKEPQRHEGHILITSRASRFANRMMRVNIEAMEEEEGITFLYRRTGRKRIAGSQEEHSAVALVAEMGGLPLALEQAAAYMIHGNPMSFTDYLTNFRQQTARSEQMMYAPEYGFNRQFQPETREYSEALTVLTTWQLSLANIEAHHAHAVQLLRLCAFLHPVGIPRELVVALLPDYFSPAADDPVKENVLYHGLLNALTDYSLIQRDLENNTHSVHVMVQMVIRDALPPEEQKRAYERILTAIAHSFPSEDYGPGGRGVHYYPHAERLLSYTEQTSTENETVGLLLHRMGAFLHYQGRSSEAEPLMKQALAVRQSTLLEGHPDIATSLNDLAALYISQDRFSEAELLLNQALAMRLKARRERHPDIVTSRNSLVESINNLGVLYLRQKLYAEAGLRFRQALKRKRKWLATDYRKIVVGLNNLAAACQGQKHFDEAECLLKEALEMTRQEALEIERLPEGSHAVAASHNNLAKLYQGQGRFEEAESHFKEALETWRKVFPEGHRVLAKSLTHLAQLYQSQGRFEEAKPLLREALSILEKILPAGHPDIVEIRNNLAVLDKRCT